MKYIVVTGGVISGLGKGLSAASIGRLLKSRGYTVSAVKIDPYLNCDAGTMNPYQHGEVYVLDDGGEVDLDLGHYERFLDISLTRDHNITTGKVFRNVIERERKGEYLGKTVQIIPHVTTEIREWVKRVGRASGADVLLLEIGGTVGDIESMPFIEAVRQLAIESGRENLLFVHTTLVPLVDTVGELKTKPTQHSVKELRSLGVSPDIIIGRSRKPLDQSTKEKISLFCDVPVEAVISAPDADSIYSIPLIMEEQGLTDFVLRRLGLVARENGLESWRNFVARASKPAGEVWIAVVGKYTDLKDSYLSHIEALNHAGAELDVKVKIAWLEAELLEDRSKEVQSLFNGVNGVLVPGGFGSRGAEGKISSAEYARTHGIPYLGICFGFQLAVIEFSRHVLGYDDAHSSELDPKTKHPVICLLPELRGVEAMGGTMRLGGYPVVLNEGSQASRLYGATEISERHRHRYEVNPEFVPAIETAGMVFSGRSQDGGRMEIAEVPSHPFFVSSQFHPEFRSRPGRPAPLYHGFVRAAVERKAAKEAAVAVAGRN